jgi:hypothetical protein
MAGKRHSSNTVQYPGQHTIIQLKIENNWPAGSYGLVEGVNGKPYNALIIKL